MIQTIKDKSLRLVFDKGDVSKIIPNLLMTVENIVARLVAANELKDMSAMFKPVHPGRILRDDYLEPLDLTVKDMAESLQISRQTLTAILNERSGVTPEMSLRLSEAFDTKPELWINLQRACDLSEAKKKYSPSGKVKQLFKADLVSG